MLKSHSFFILTFLLSLCSCLPQTQNQSLSIGKISTPVNQVGQAEDPSSSEAPERPDLPITKPVPAPSPAPMPVPMPKPGTPVPMPAPMPKPGTPVPMPAPMPKPEPPVSLSGEFIKLTPSRVEITDSQSQFLRVEFGQEIRVSDANGFRTVGGPSLVKAVRSVEGNTIILELTSPVIPGHGYKLIYWQEFGDLSHDSKKVQTFEVSVENKTVSYKGTGKLLFVSSKSGSDSNQGTQAAPLKTIMEALEDAKTGDTILLKRGDVFSPSKRTMISDMFRSPIIIPTSGLTISNYGSGALPIIQSKAPNRDYPARDTMILVNNKNNIHINGVHLKVEANEVAMQHGVLITNGSKNGIVSNVKIESVGAGCYFGVSMQGDERMPWGKSQYSFANLKPTYRPQLLNSEVKDCFKGVGTSAWPYHRSNSILGGALVENNKVHGFENSYKRDAEPIHFNRGPISGTIIRKNEVTDFQGNGIETFCVDNSIIEYNHIHHSRDVSKADADRFGIAAKATGIKAGGLNNGSETTSKIKCITRNSIARFNHVHDIKGHKGPYIGMKTATSIDGQFYGNIVYDIQDIGIKLEDTVAGDGWKIYNNTVIDTKNAFEAYLTPRASFAFPNEPTKLLIYNNILLGSSRSIVIHGSYSIRSKAKGEDNVILGGSTSSSTYQSSTDQSSNVQTEFSAGKTFPFLIKTSGQAHKKGTRNYIRIKQDYFGRPILESEMPSIGANY